MSTCSISRKSSFRYSKSHGTALSSGLVKSKSIGSGLSSGYGTGYSFSSGYSSGYSFSTYIARTSTSYTPSYSSLSPMVKSLTEAKDHSRRAKNDNKIRSKSVDSSIFKAQHGTKCRKVSSEASHQENIICERANQSDELSSAKRNSLTSDQHEAKNEVVDYPVKDFRITIPRSRKGSIFKDGYCEAPSLDEIASKAVSSRGSSVPRTFSRCSSVLPDLETESFLDYESSTVLLDQLTPSRNYSQTQDTSGISKRSCERDARSQSRYSVSEYDLAKAAAWAQIGAKNRDSRDSSELNLIEISSHKRDSFLVIFFH